MISTSRQLRDQEIKRVSDFYDWIRDDWLDISTDANGRNPGMLNFGYWKADTTNLCDAQIALIDKIFGWLQLPRTSNQPVGLEVGCGIGGAAVHLVRKMKVQLFCLDIVYKQLEIARERVIQEGVANFIFFQQGDGRSMPFASNTFDFSYCIESSFHYQDVPTFLSENLRVLKPGATAIIADITCKAPEAVRFRNGNFFYDFEVMQDWLQQVGFEIVALERIGSQVFSPLYAYQVAINTPGREKLRRYWRLVLKNYAELAAAGLMGYDIFVVRKPATHRSESTATSVSQNEAEKSSVSSDETSDPAQPDNTAR